jgi:autotransporter-associated beta strand protein
VQSNSLKVIRPGESTGSPGRSRICWSRVLEKLKRGFVLAGVVPTMGSTFWNRTRPSMRALVTVLVVALIGGSVSPAWAQQTFVPNATGTYSWIDGANWSPSFPVFPDGQNAAAVFIGLSADTIRTVELNKNIVLGSLTLNNPSQQGGYGVTIASGGDGSNELFFVSFGSNAKIENRIGVGLQNSSVNTLIQVPVVLGSNLDVYGDQRRNDLTGMNLAGGIIGSSDRVFTKKATDAAGSSLTALQANVTIGASPNFDGKIVVEGGGVHTSGGNNLAASTGITVNSGGQFVVDAMPAQFNLASGAILSLSGAGKPDGFGPQGAFRYQDGNSTSSFNSSVQLRDQGATIFVNATNAAAGQVGTLVLSNQVSGATSGQKLTKDGSGVLVVASNTGNNYSGGTDVLAGTLRISNNTGSATGAGAVTVFSGATLAGTGTIGGPLAVADGGLVSPGDPGTLSGVGTLQIGSSTQFGGANSMLSVDLASASSFDRLDIAGAATLAGALAIHLANGFQPMLGDSFSVMNFSSVTGDFSNYTNTYLGGFLELRHQLTSNDLLLVARPAVDGDVNLDGIVNGQDIAMASSNWLSQDVHGDANGDGIVNGQDIALISANWLQFYGGAGAASTVPEPSTAALAAFAAIIAFLNLKTISHPDSQRIFR